MEGGRREDRFRVCEELGGLEDVVVDGGGGEGAPQEELFADFSEEGAVEAEPGGGGAGFADEGQVDFKDVGVGGGVDGEPEFLDDAQVVGGEPDAAVEAADGRDDDFRVQI